jgi:hypothetical protein
MRINVQLRDEWEIVALCRIVLMVAYFNMGELGFLW